MKLYYERFRDEGDEGVNSFRIKELQTDNHISYVVRGEMEFGKYFLLSEKGIFLDYFKVHIEFNKHNSSVRSARIKSLVNSSKSKFTVIYNNEQGYYDGPNSHPVVGEVLRYEGKRFLIEKVRVKNFSEFKLHGHFLKENDKTPFKYEEKRVYFEKLYLSLNFGSHCCFQLVDEKIKGNKVKFKFLIRPEETNFEPHWTINERE